MNHRDADEIRPGLRRTDAIAAFESSCCRPGQTLWITESWFAPRRARLEKTLSEVITEDEASALSDALHQRHSVDFVIDWLETQPRPAWSEFAQQHEADVRASELADMRRRYYLVERGIWESPQHSRDEDATELLPHLFWQSATPDRRAESLRMEGCEQATVCPECGRDQSTLEWRFVDLVSPFDGVSVDRGWLALCHPCRVIAVEMFPRPEIAWFGLGIPATRHLQRHRNRAGERRSMQ